MIAPTYLANKNKHPRDKNIQFFEEGHRYLVNGKSGFTSTTTYIHSLFSHFDADGIIAGILKKKDWSDNPDYKYYKMTAKEIADMWKKNGELASSAGTKMHYNIECYFNNMQYDIDLQNGDEFALSLMDTDDAVVMGGDTVVVGDDAVVMGGDTVVVGDDAVVMDPDKGVSDDTSVVGDDAVVMDPDKVVSDDTAVVVGDDEEDCVIFMPSIDDGSKEYEYFKNFIKEIVMVEELEPYRTEMLVYDEDVKITGSIDMLYRKKNGEYAIFDWKRSKEISYEGFRGKKSQNKHIRHLDDSNFWHYSLQLNIYRRILQKNYGLIVSDLRLVILHPDNNDYMCLIVPFLDNEIDSLFTARENEVKLIIDNNYVSK